MGLFNCAMRAVAKKLINLRTLHKSTLFNSTRLCEFFLFQPGAVKQISRVDNVPILLSEVLKGTLNDSKKGRIIEMRSAYMLWKLQKSRDRRINIKTFEFLFDN